MSLDANVQSLAVRAGDQDKALKTLINGNAADLAALTTTTKTNLVAAINWLHDEVQDIAGSSSGINDAGTSLSTTWSSTKIDTEIDAAVAALVGSAPANLNTLQELADALASDDTDITTINTALANRVRYDAAQTLTGPQQAQARSNIGAGTSSLVIGVGAGDAAAGNHTHAGVCAPVSHSHTAAEISNSTVTGRAVLMAADAAAARTAIGAGTSSLVIGTGAGDAKAGNYQPTAANISDSSAVGRAVLTAVDAAAARTAIGAGTSSLTLGSTGGTAAPGNHDHNSVYAPISHNHTAAQISDSTAVGRSVLTAATAAAALTAIGGVSSTDVGSTTTDYVALFEAALVCV